MRAVVLTVVLAAVTASSSADDQPEASLLSARDRQALVGKWTGPRVEAFTKQDGRVDRSFQIEFPADERDQLLLLVAERHPKGGSSRQYERDFEIGSDQNGHFLVWPDGHREVTETVGETTRLRNERVIAQLRYELVGDQLQIQGSINRSTQYPVDGTEERIDLTGLWTRLK